MATYTNFLVGGTTGHPTKMRTPYLVEAVVDFSKQNTTTTSDVFQVLNVPAESVVLYAGWEVLTAVTGLTTPALTLGYGGDVDEWVASTATVTAGYATTVGDGTAAAVAKVFTSADTIDLVVGSASGAATAGKIRVFALIQDISGIRETATGDQG